MAINKNMSIDFEALFQQAQRQFSDLDPRDPSLWPAFPRHLLCVVVMAGVVAVAWFAWLTDFQTQLDAEVVNEQALKEDFGKKLTKAVNLDALKKQREQIQQYVTQLEKQLPGKAEMSALLSDINQAGLGRSLQFELFRPGQMVVKEYYAELPISIRVTGKYHDIGYFASDVAHLSRIVTLNNLTLTPVREGLLSMDATARTFRYLDTDEIASQRKAGGAK
ncbi:type 4a pilus biogenesis protein PilO [Curvibacter sp. RS43]|jgi:type IV pilus assembly protein PilO|uniref:Type 4a pilus biogenesis protein PilO n=1 Tax=Curvibacter microcysteis TaxID=3026419 RepID=A0ABT5MI69_9BURK|nr:MULTISPECIES: type 4a pilus biogenesis protein PilO [unclassified Curvibacter]MDD0810324.1 type 4a pilus biogenesis protein PilO [Curvibacter sp. RS43]MDD0816278.1 type 4a pilus biogenesis protein PilO [Curvibacter sp. HBC28]